MKYLRSFAFVLAALAFAGSARADYIAYDVMAGLVGNQIYTGSVGMDFNVNSNIVVKQLGAFDSLGNGLNSAVQVSIYDRNTQSLLATAAVPAGTSATLINGSRFVSIPALSLVAGGKYTVVSVYKNTDTMFNTFGQISPVPSVLNTGAGLISFVGSGRYSAGTGFPTIVDTSEHLVNPYAAATFVFAVPEPGSVALFVIGSIGLIGYSRRRSLHLKQAQAQA